MAPGGGRERSGSELVFGVLKTLMIAYQLWGAESSVELSALPGSLGVSDGCVGGILEYLAAEGLVRVDTTTGTVRLTAHGVRNLFGSLSS